MYFLISQEEYLSYLARLLIHIKELGSDCESLLHARGMNFMENSTC